MRDAVRVGEYSILQPLFSLRLADLTHVCLFPEGNAVWDAYWQTVEKNPLDWGILALGGALIAVHIVGLVGRFHGKRVLFVQDLDRFRTFCLLITELLPVLGLLGTVFSLMYTFKSFPAPTQGETPNLTQMVNAFAPAMSTTISGLIMICPNLVLNAILWLASPLPEKRDGIQ